jgi:hypothetical protein
MEPAGARARFTEYPGTTLPFPFLGPTTITETDQFDEAAFSNRPNPILHIEEHPVLTVTVRVSLPTVHRVLQILPSDPTVPCTLTFQLAGTCYSSIRREQIEVSILH